MQGDRVLVEGLRTGGPEGLGPVFDAYAARLVAYARTLLRDTAAAEDAVHDSLLVALDRIDQLRDPDLLRPWLFAITRNECLRQLRAASRTTDDEEAIDMLPSTDDLDAGLRQQESAQLVDDAMAALNPGDRDILALALQHDLDGPSVARVLGLGANEVHARLSRARTQLATAVTSVLLVRTRGADCPELAALLDGEGPTLTPLLRKRVARHARECDNCEERGRRGVAMALPAAGLPVVVAAPTLGLRERLLGTSADVAAPGGDAREAELVRSMGERAGAFDADGFPSPGEEPQGWLAPVADVSEGAAAPAPVVPLGRRGRRRTAGWVAAAVVALVGFGALLLALLLGGTDGVDATAGSDGAGVAVGSPTGPASPLPVTSSSPESAEPGAASGSASATPAQSGPAEPVAVSATGGTDAGAVGDGAVGTAPDPAADTAGSAPPDVAAPGDSGTGRPAPSRTPTPTPTPNPTRTQTAPAPAPPASVTPDPAGSATSAAAPTAPPTTAPAPAPAPTAPAPPPAAPAVIGVSVTDLDVAGDGSFTRCDAFRLQAAVTTSGEVTGVSATVSPSPGSVPLAPAGSGSWSGQYLLAPGTYTVTVTATGPGGSVTATPVAVQHICPA
ncbi:MAG: sigma-70 family RNA polymerase sigma factor [Candidatus Nanopelagicales bacterium]